MSQLITDFVFHHPVMSWLLVGSAVAEMCRRAAVKVCIADGTEWRGGWFALIVRLVITVIWPMAVWSWIYDSYRAIKMYIVKRRTGTLKGQVNKDLDEQQCNGAG